VKNFGWKKKKQTQVKNLQTNDKARKKISLLLK
jgi:hypothetical protein